MVELFKKYERTVTQEMVVAIVSWDNMIDLALRFGGRIETEDKAPRLVLPNERVFEEGDTINTLGHPVIVVDWDE